MVQRSSSVVIVGTLVCSPGSARSESRAGREQQGKRFQTRDRTVREFSGKIAAWHCQVMAVEQGGEASPRASTAAQNM